VLTTLSRYASRWRRLREGGNETSVFDPVRLAQRDVRVTVVAESS
jgi:hypothetical protein